MVDQVCSFAELGFQEFETVNCPRVGQQDEPAHRRHCHRDRERREDRDTTAIALASVGGYYLQAIGSRVETFDLLVWGVAQFGQWGWSPAGLPAAAQAVAAHRLFPQLG